jgi:hypothetical protein
MNRKKATAKNAGKAALVVARASGATWVVAYARQVIPGALFRSKESALSYASSLANAMGLRSPDVLA